MTGTVRVWRHIQQRYNLIGSKCTNCGRVFFPPRVICPDCRRKGNIEDIRKKLQSFFLRYPDYTDEQVITATQKYVNSMNGNYTYLKLLKYFIWKSEVKDGEQVVTSILSDYIENEGQEDNINNDWTSELK